MRARRTIRRALGLALVVLPLLALSGLASGEQETLPPPKPVVRFDWTTHDFGEIPADRKVSHRWIYHNDGQATLAILGTRPMCGCTVSTIEKKEIPPGGTGVLEVTFDPAGQEGSVRRTIAVLTNDPARPTTHLAVKAKVLPKPEPAGSSGHPRWTGQSLLMGSCASCHSAPAAGKSGEALWAAVCAMCHGARAEGGLAPGLRAPDYLAAHDDEALAAGVAYGTANPRMPGFSDVMGGPLSRAQVDSLVKLLREWGPLSADKSAGR